MPQIKVDFSKAPDFSIPPEGLYTVEVEAVEVKKTSKGEAAMNLTLVIVDDEENSGKKLFKLLMLEGKGTGFTKEALQALLGEAREEFDTEELVGATGRVYVYHDTWAVADGGDGQTRAKIKNFITEDTAATAEDIEDLFS